MRERAGEGERYKEREKERGTVRQTDRQIDVQMTYVTPYFHFQNSRNYYNKIYQ